MSTAISIHENGKWEKVKAKLNRAGGLSIDLMDENMERHSITIFYDVMDEDFLQTLAREVGLAAMEAKNGGGE